MTDQTPTPTQTAPDAVREVIAGYFTSMGLTDERRARFDADAILAAIAATGYTIAEPGQIVVDDGFLDRVTSGIRPALSDAEAILAVNRVINAMRAANYTGSGWLNEFLNKCKQEGIWFHTALSVGADQDAGGEQGRD